MFWTIRDALVRDKWRAIPMTIGAVCLTSFFQVVQNTSWGFQPVQNLGSVKAVDPLWLAVLRTPLSLFVPALDLPVWGPSPRSCWCSGSRRSASAGGAPC